MLHCPTHNFELYEPATTQPDFRRVAIVHDWLVVKGGAEVVLRELIALFPDCDLFSVVDFLSDSDRAMVSGKYATTTFIQNLPFAQKKYRAYLPLMPFAIEQLDLSGYDLVISSSHAVAKGVITGPDQIHICYCHTPIRYAWDLQHQYLCQTGMMRGPRGLSARLLLHYIRIWDLRTAISVDRFVANSSYIARRIGKIYRRDAQVVYPPVDVQAFTARLDKDDFYFTASRLVPYKRVDLIVEAFARMPQRRLIVIGEGPEMERIARLAGPNVTLLGFQPNAVLLDHLQRARAFLFSAEEDFGILPVEAQLCGTPVIAFGKGGALETVIDVDNPESRPPTGLFYYQQTVPALIDAVERFEASYIDPEDCRVWAETFSIAAFRKAFGAIVSSRHPAKHDVLPAHIVLD